MEAPMQGNWLVYSLPVVDSVLILPQCVNIATVECDGVISWRHGRL